MVDHEFNTMKLRDLFGPPDIIDLVESLKYEPPDLVWNNDEGTFKINNIEYVASIRPATDTEKRSYSPFFNPVPTIGNLEFSAVTPELGRIQDTTNKAKSGVFKVFGGVAYIAEQLIKKYQYKIVLCVAKKKANPTKFSDRVESYRNIIPRISKDIGWANTEMISTNDETIFAVFHPAFSKGIQSVKSHLIKHYR